MPSSFLTSFTMAGALALGALLPVMAEESLPDVSEWTLEQQVSYAAGQNAQKQIPPSFDKAFFIAGLEDAEPKIDPATYQQLFAQFQQKQQAAQAGAASENAQKGAAYLAEKEKEQGVIKTASGLLYEVLKKGKGNQPQATSRVQVHYQGSLIDGTVFDSSYDRGQPTEFPLNQVISGWTEGLQLMKEGAKYRFHIPAELAYGKRAPASIGPDQTLVFDVELLKILQ